MQVYVIEATQAVFASRINHLIINQSIKTNKILDQKMAPDEKDHYIAHPEVDVNVFRFKLQV